jgi:hypothetical protein
VRIPPEAPDEGLKTKDRREGEEGGGEETRNIRNLGFLKIENGRKVGFNGRPDVVPFLTPP